MQFRQWGSYHEQLRPLPRNFLYFMYYYIVNRQVEILLVQLCPGYTTDLYYCYDVRMFGLPIAGVAAESVVAGPVTVLL